MVFPDDLPIILEYRLGTYPSGVCTVVALPRTPVKFLSTSGNTNAHDVCPKIPFGCTGWKRMGDLEWKPVSELPESWLPFLNRKRPSEMDPRPPTRTGRYG